MSLAEPASITLVERLDPDGHQLLLSERPSVQHGGDEDWSDHSLPETPAEMNTVFGTTLQLTNTMIGAGILAFPYVVGKVGLVWFSLLLPFFAVATYLSSSYVVLSTIRLRSLSYSDVAERVFGMRVRQTLNVAIFTANMGSLMSYLNTIGDLGHQVFKHWASGVFVDTYAGFMLVFVPLFTLPTVLTRSYGELQLISYGAVAFIVLVIVLTGVIGGYSDGTPDKFQVPDALPHNPWNVLKKLGTFSFAFACQYSMVEAYASMAPGAKDRWQTSVVGAVVLGATLLVAMAIVGYGVLGSDVEGEVVTSLDASDTLAQLTYLGVCLHLLFYIPNDFVIMRLFFFKIFDLNVLKVPSQQFIAISIVLMAIPIVLMAAIPPSDVVGVFNLIIDLTGDAPTGFAAFALPSMLYLQLFHEERGVLWWLAWPVLGVGLLLCVVCPVVTLAAFGSACKTDGCGSY